MAIFSNQATLSFNGASTNSNIAYGEILEVLTATKTAIEGTYQTGEPVTYVVALRNTGAAALTGLTITDDLGGFDFTKTENDLYILAFLKKHNNDVEATDAYLRDMWGEDYDGYAKEYQLQDVYAGRYHGKGEDLTAEISTYLSKMYSGSAKERVGCVVVDERLAEILQLLMDKYTFEDVDHAWTKLCYYYDYLGPEG